MGLFATHRNGGLAFEVNLRGPGAVPGDDLGAKLGPGLIMALFPGAEVRLLPDGGQVIRFEVEVP